MILCNPAPTLPATGSPISALDNLPDSSTESSMGWDRGLYEKTSEDNKKRGSIISTGTLVVCPVSLVSQWAEEARSKLADPGLVYEYHGHNRKRDASKLAQASIVVTTYQILASDSTYHKSKSNDDDYCPPLEQIRWWRVICDEGHGLRENNTHRSKSVFALVADIKWIVTGTPINTGVKDIRNLMKFIGLEESDKMFSVISGVHETRSRRRNQGQSLLNPDFLFYLMRPLLIRHSQAQKYKGTDTTLMSLPPMSESVVECEFSPEERVEFQKLEKEAQDFYLEFRRRHAKDMSKHFLKVSSKLIKLRIACSGGKYPLDDASHVTDDLDEDGEDDNEEAAAEKPKPVKKVTKYSDFCFQSKFNELLKQLKKIRDEEPDAKSLVFSQFASSLEFLQQELPKHGFSFRTLKGSMSKNARAKALHDFQNDPPTTIFLLSTRSAACGINLTQANRVFLLERKLFVHY